MRVLITDSSDNTHIAVEVACMCYDLEERAMYIYSISGDQAFESEPGVIDRYDYESIVKDTFDRGYKDLSHYKFNWYDCDDDEEEESGACDYDDGMR